MSERAFACKVELENMKRSRSFKIETGWVRLGGAMAMATVVSVSYLENLQSFLCCSPNLFQNEGCVLYGQDIITRDAVKLKAMNDWKD